MTDYEIYSMDNYITKDNLWETREIAKEIEEYEDRPICTICAKDLEIDEIFLDDGETFCKECWEQEVNDIA